MDETGRFPWARAMQLGLGVLRLPPAAFWSMTLPELDCALRGVLGDPVDMVPPSRMELETLMHRFPDRLSTSTDHGRL